MKISMKEQITRIVMIMIMAALILSVVPSSIMAAEVPGVPMGFVVTPGDGSVTLSWSEPEYDGGLNITGYRIYRGIMPDGLGIVEDVTDMFYTDSGLQNGETYFYAVSALNSEGEGETTEILPATPEADSPPMTKIVVADYTTFVIIHVNEGVYFDIAGGTYSLVVESITGTNVLLTLSPNLQSFIMSEGDSKNIDVNSDGTDDFKITCVRITGEPAEGFPQTAEFSFTKNVEESGTPGFELILVFIAVSLILLRRRKKI